MPYTPLNQYVFQAALSGAFGGTIGGQPITSGDEGTYELIALASLAFAEELDTQWGAGAVDVVEYGALVAECTNYWCGREPTSELAEVYSVVCTAIIAAAKELSVQSIAAGYTPPSYPPGGATVAPLSRTLSVDGGYAGSSPNGSISAPFQTISAALSAIPQPTSIADANSIWQVCVFPCLNGYSSEPGNTVAIPAYRRIWIQLFTDFTSDSLAPDIPGSNLTANVTWANTAAAGGSFKPTAASYLTISGLQVVGNLTVTDDATSDETVLLTAGASITGNIIGTGATALEDLTVEFESFVDGNIDAPSCYVHLNTNGGIFGNITCLHMENSVGASAGFGTLTSASGGYDINLFAGGQLDGATISGGAGLLCESSQILNRTGSLVSDFVLTQSNITGGSLSCVAATMTGSVFAGGFQLTATTIVADSSTWGSYLAQGGLPTALHCRLRPTPTSLRRLAIGHPLRQRRTPLRSIALPRHSTG